MIETAFEIELGGVCYFIRLEVLSTGKKGSCKACQKPASSKKIVITELQECKIGVDLKRKTKIIAFIKIGEKEHIEELCHKGLIYINYF